jgi:hypothetical protein
MSLDYQEKQAILQEMEMLRGELARFHEERVAAQHAKDVEEYNPTTGMSTLEKLGAGFNTGLVSGAKGAGNLLGLVSDEDVEEFRKLTAPLEETGAGFAGSLAGQMALTAPVGGTLGASAKGLQALRGAPQAVRGLSRAVGSLPGRGAVEGAISSAMYSAPDRQLEGAGAGGVLGGALGVAGKVGKRMLTGLARQSDDAKALELMAEQAEKKIFIPLAQSIDDKADILSRLIKTTYKEGMPYVPGVGGKFRAQSEKLMEDVRAIALKEPDFLKVLTPDLLKNPQQAIAALRSAADAEMNSVIGRRFVLDVGRKQSAEIGKRIRAALPEVDATTVRRTQAKVRATIQRFAGKGKKDIHGTNLLNTKNALMDRLVHLKGPEKEAMQHAVEYVDDLIRKQLSPDDLKRYNQALGTWGDFQAVDKAVKQAVAKGGEFDVGQLARAATQSPTQREIAQTAERVTRNKIGLPGAAGRWVSRAVGLYSLGSNPLMSVAIWTGLNAAATKSIQNALLGKGPIQRWMVSYLKKRPDITKALGSAGRAAVTTEAGEETNASER